VKYKIVGWCIEPGKSEYTEVVVRSRYNQVAVSNYGVNKQNPGVIGQPDNVAARRWLCEAELDT
jgi:hypothetical protein